MIVVADTSPLNYLILIDEIELLPKIFGRILIPGSVLRELQHPRTPEKVRTWAAELPGWISVRNGTSEIPTSLMALDPGEREAIQLALELGVATILIDEAAGRREAEALHLEVRGTLGILERGAILGFTDLLQALNRLEQTSFRISPAVKAAFLRRSY
jgi:predicted nucleic acid-binding protein